MEEKTSLRKTKQKSTWVKYGKIFAACRALLPIHCSEEVCRYSDDENEVVILPQFQLQFEV